MSCLLQTNIDIGNTIIVMASTCEQNISRGHVFMQLTSDL